MNHVLATEFIASPRGNMSLIKRDYRTHDIIAQILRDDKKAWRDTVNFANALKYKNLTDLSKQLFDLLLNHVQYQEDAAGSQVVRLPGFLWASKQGDCKSYSLFIGSVLKNLGIPYSYRFVSFSEKQNPTHVYVIAHGKNSDIIIDAVYKKFNQEKSYTFKKDFRMEGLYRIEGVGATAPKKKTDLILRKPVDQLSEADIELEIARQRLEIERDIVAKRRGIGSAKVSEYDATINGINKVIGLVDSGNREELEQYIGSLKSVAKKFVKKTTALTKVTAKALTKLATFPIRLAAKGILEIWLPKAAPSFIYLFITDKNTIAKLPPKAKQKRIKQVAFADFVVKGIGMKRNHFMGILRNNIMRRYKMSPEAKIAQIMKSKGRVDGIGVIDDAVKAVQEIVKLISKATGKKAPSFSKSDVADASDFASASNAQKEQIAKEVKSKPEAVEPGESIPETGGKKVVGICG